MERSKMDAATLRVTEAVTMLYTNEQGTHESLRDLALRHWAGAEEDTGRPLSRSQIARFNMADHLKEDAEDRQPGDLPQPYSDLLTIAVAWVDWDDVADTYLCDVDGYVPCGSDDS